MEKHFLFKNTPDELVQKIIEVENDFQDTATLALAIVKVLDNFLKDKDIFINSEFEDLWEAYLSYLMRSLKEQ